MGRGRPRGAGSNQARLEPSLHFMPGFGWASQIPPIASCRKPQFVLDSGSLSAVWNSCLQTPVEKNKHLEDA